MALQLDAALEAERQAKAKGKGKGKKARQYSVGSLVECKRETMFDESDLPQDLQRVYRQLRKDNGEEYALKVRRARPICTPVQLLPDCDHEAIVWVQPAPPAPSPRLKYPLIGNSRALHAMLA